MSEIVGSSSQPSRLDRLREFVIQFGTLVGDHSDEATILNQGAELLRTLVSVDDWLPALYAEPDPLRYRQYLLHADSQERFSVVSFVWGPGQTTPIHDHTVWGLIGMLRGSEREQRYIRTEDGSLIESGPQHQLEPGDVGAVSPSVGDLHKVSNTFQDKASISIHVYGANIGAVRRSVYETSGAGKSFISGYSNADMPNFWDASK